MPSMSNEVGPGGRGSPVTGCRTPRKVRGRAAVGLLGAYDHPPEPSCVRNHEFERSELSPEGALFRQHRGHDPTCRGPRPMSGVPDSEPATRRSLISSSAPRRETHRVVKPSRCGREPSSSCGVAISRGGAGWCALSNHNAWSKDSGRRSPCCRFACHVREPNPRKALCGNVDRHGARICADIAIAWGRL